MLSLQNFSDNFLYKFNVQKMCDTPHMPAIDAAKKSETVIILFILSDMLSTIWEGVTNTNINEHLELSISATEILDTSEIPTFPLLKYPTFPMLIHSQPM